VVRCQSRRHFGKTKSKTDSEEGRKGAVGGGGSGGGRSGNNCPGREVKGCNIIDGLRGIIPPTMDKQNYLKRSASYCIENNIGTYIYWETKERCCPISKL
jgi:hypothetical protein